LFSKALLIACLSALLIAPSFASPGDEIARAVAVNGASNVSQARPNQFLRAFGAIALRTQTRELPAYVIAAVGLRPDLAPKIVVVALRTAARQLGSKHAALSLITDRIVRAAIAANSDAAVSIARAAIEAFPALRQCVVAAAISAAPSKEAEIQAPSESPSASLGLITLAGSDDAGFSIGSDAFNPANVSDLSGSTGVNSPEQPPSH
jgi:hypothetical protein